MWQIERILTFILYITYHCVVFFLCLLISNVLSLIRTIRNSKPSQIYLPLLRDFYRAVTESSPSHLRAITEGSPRAPPVFCRLSCRADMAKSTTRCTFLPKYLHISIICCTFASAFPREGERARKYCEVAIQAMLL